MEFRKQYAVVKVLITLQIVIVMTSYCRYH